MEVMQGGSKLQKEVEGLSKRIDDGVGQGSKYYQTQLRVQKQKSKVKKLGLNGRSRHVMFDIYDEPGTAIPE